ncbi:MAG: spirocyclase AveC family protein [Proteobacteria bacterium]|nr:spirocyclase AveC family protein [Pseudomonadota bacterium]
MFNKTCLYGFMILFIALVAYPAMAATDITVPSSQQLESGTAGAVVDNMQLPPGFNNPNLSAIWVQEKLMLVVFFIVLIYLIRNSRRARELTFGTLLFIATTTMFWQEPYADWGCYLLFNPKLTLMPWGSTLWTSPNKPLNLIWQYGAFFAGIYSVMLWLVRKLHARYPQLSNLGAVLVIGIPIFYLFDLLVEGLCVKNGIHSYIKPLIGPVFVMAKGNFPLVYPVVPFVFYAVITLWVLRLRAANGHVRFESWFGAQRFAAGWQRELARVIIWILVMNGLYLLLFTGPAVAIRVFLGGPCALVP